MYSLSCRSTACVQLELLQSYIVVGRSVVAGTSNTFCCSDAAGVQKQLQTAQEQVSQVQQHADADSERLQQAHSKADAALKQAKQDLDQVQHHAYSSVACR